MQILANGINTLKSTCMDTTLLGAFLENHDNPRFASLTSDITLAKNAIAFAMLADGIPIVYQGQEQHFSGGSVPYNREAIWLSGYNKAATLYTHIAKINAIRTQAIKNDEQGYLTTNAVPLSTNQHTIVMRKGGNDTQVIGVFSNVGAGGRGANVSVSASGSGFDGGMQLTEILSCGQYTTDGQGNLPLVLYSTLQMKGSGLCGY
jgi:alpha-amylase